MTAGAPNVVWITLDSVRADHTSLYGYHRATTPEIARIASGGTVFENCFAHSVATAASTASIFTGATPSRHQVAMSDAVGEIPDQLRTAGELFRDAGYRTACVTTNPRIELVGADAGFEEFRDVSRSTLLQPRNLTTTAKFLRNLWSHSVGVSTDAHHHSFSYVVNDLARQWVESVVDGPDPFFLYLHYNEPHRPYTPPLSFRDRFAEDLDLSTSAAVDVATDLHEHAEDYIADGLPLSDAEWEAITAMFDAEIAYADQQVGRFVDAVRSMDDGNTVFVVTADHGELLGEEGLYGHLHSVNDALIHVPMVVVGLEDLPDRERGIVQHGDVMKTLLSMAGASTDQFAGVDVREDTREFAVSQEYLEDYSIYERRNPEFDSSDRPVGRLDALRTHDHKLVTASNGTWLYELPDERTDRALEHPDLVERLSGDLEAWLAEHGQPLVEPPSEDDYDEATKRRLADLGYLE